MEIHFTILSFENFVFMDFYPNAQWARIDRNGSKNNNSNNIDFREKIVKDEIIIYAKSKNCAFFIHNFKGNFRGFFLQLL